MQEGGSGGREGEAGESRALQKSDVSLVTQVHVPSRGGYLEQMWQDALWMPLLPLILG